MMDWCLALEDPVNVPEDTAQPKPEAGLRVWNMAAGATPAR